MAVRCFTYASYQVTVVGDLQLTVEHDGSLSWDLLMQIKDTAWGSEAAAIEVYPPLERLINKGPIRHLWRLGRSDFYPDLIGDPAAPDGPAATLAERYKAAFEPETGD